VITDGAGGFVLRSLGCQPLRRANYSANSRSGSGDQGANGAAADTRTTHPLPTFQTFELSHPDADPPRHRNTDRTWRRTTPSSVERNRSRDRRNEFDDRDAAELTSAIEGATEQLACESSPGSLGSVW
jgi:hypothetical protein